MAQWVNRLRNNMHSSQFFQVKPIGRLFYEVQKSGNHTISYQSLLLSTTVLNDKYIM